MTSVPFPEISLEPWLNKVLEWGSTTSPEIQQDVLLRLPELHEFLQKMYQTLKHMEPTTAIEKLPALGQFLGRLCWNPFVIGHEDTRQMLISCLSCLFSSEPQNAIDRKANSWIKELFCHLLSSSGKEREDPHVFASLECTAVDYYEKLLKNIISSLIKQLRRSPQDNKTELSAEHVRSMCITCIPFLTLAEVVPLLEALLHYQGTEPYEVLDSQFLYAVNDAIQKKKIVLSESAVLSLWLRHLPSLENAVLDLLQRLIALQSKSFREMEQIIKDSYLPQAACNPAIFSVTDDIFRGAILESEGNIKIITIIRLFTHCFLHEYYKDNAKARLPLRAYFSYKNTPLVLALLRKGEGLAPNTCIQHLHTIVKLLRSVDSEERSHENVFQSWFLLIRLGGWVDIAAEQLLTSDPEISDDLLWLLAFYYNPCNESQSRGRTMVEAKAVYECLVSLRRSSTICAMSFHKLFVQENKPDTWHPTTLQLIRHLCATFLVFCPEWHSVAKDCVSYMTQTQEATSEVSDVLARTLSRLDIPGMECQKMITIVYKLLQDL
ncbi:Fanconi anemia group C protein isoform X1 [Bufo bufo]|uniref:Fanconi anemia group C protein isoform X1 n=1 Tax=Bufo bufo TaxID=8384 RepID=UPI001ABE21D5|nr:Fanconi anemia group C protein isoform X1 [Bufo bufo]XP_040272927.1 Fanconi anemia group C protein isoform X1 [Bufo bufo]XP_040272928.1 Fanconi anemia group C protein isoform X1 [Bufo bufo]